MVITDIFSWIHKNELSLEEIERLVTDAEKGLSADGYSVEHRLPAGADENAAEVEAELRREGKRVCFLLKEGRVISAVGYRADEHPANR